MNIKNLIAYVSLVLTILLIQIVSIIRHRRGL